MRLKPGVIPPGLLELLAQSYRSYGVIRSYKEYRVIPPGVIGVIDTELSELWGYKVIHPGV